MFSKGNQYGSKTKRGKNKIDQDLREQLKNITKEVLDSIDVKELTRTQRISFLKTSVRIPLLTWGGNIRAVLSVSAVN